MLFASTAIEQRIRKLQTHLSQENPVLLDVVRSFRSLDRVAYALGVLDREESFATRVPWWPMISVLGTFSSGKSTFINHYLGQKLQTTGNQAVDDRFTVVCFGGDETSRTLPGLALDADPRFPFYRISRDIEAVAAGEGARVDSYLQLKTCRSEALRGKILIDSPGFDADEQRTSTLRITDHIIDLSDLVLVFFDARHPEPGAMQDTLQHLVRSTLGRRDTSKFLFVLNQIDNAAREDNPEEVFAAWQRALAQCGLTAGKFYATYNPEAAVTIDDPKLRRRFQERRDADTAAILERVERVEVERAYRIIAVLEQTARRLRDEVVPALTEARARWRRRTLWFDAAAGAALLAAVLGWTIPAGYWHGLRFAPPWLDGVFANLALLGVIGVVAAGVIGYAHFALRRLAAHTVAAGLRRNENLGETREWVLRGFASNTRAWVPLALGAPIGWGGGARRRIERALADAARYVQTLNNRFADPSGHGGKRHGARPAPPSAPPSAPAAPPVAAEAVSGIQAAGES